MTRVIHLRRSDSLACQVADVLTHQGERDLSRVEVWIPTAGAGRRIRRELAVHGVLSPQFTQPMRALLPTGVRLAERYEREGTWARVLSAIDRQFLEPLFSGARLDSDTTRLRSGGVLCDLCDLLAEGAKSPSDPHIVDVCSEDAARWEVLGRIYECYLAALNDAGLTDPNEARFQELETPSRQAAFDRLVIACIPDLPMAAQRYAERIASIGVQVDVLTWLPDGVEAFFDPWGRPDPTFWAEHLFMVDAEQIMVARSPLDEARQVLDFVSQSSLPGDYAVILADPTLGSSFRNEVESRGGNAFLPDGSGLDSCEAGIMAVTWSHFQSSGDLRSLRRLLELPHFNRLLRDDSSLRSDDCLAICDFLIGDAVLSEFSQAEALSEIASIDQDVKHLRRNQSVAFVELVKRLSPLTVPELIARAWRVGGEGIEEARAVASLYECLQRSPVFEDSPSCLDHAFARALKAAPVFGSSSPGDIELSGWLEAPWSDACRLAGGGFVEGVLPSLVNGHPFLPDSKRHALGLSDNASRFARDAYLFQCLLITRSANEFRVSFSRFDGEGSPALPSSLLMRCHGDLLPDRALMLFGKLPTGSSIVERQNQWRWSLPDGMHRQLGKMSPTDFSHYLACPFRFYLRRVLWLDSFRADAHEMDPKQFGTLMHEALEKFGRESPLESDPNTIERIVFDYLDKAVVRHFGSSPSPAVRVQVAAAKLRLRGFARVQAEQFDAGWRIVSAERKLEANGENALKIGPLDLSGKIDRIERNVVTGAWRVVDYKTHTKADPPQKKHFRARLDDEWLPSAELEFFNGKKQIKKRWADLQLPLYLKILRHWHADEIGGNHLSAAYFTLSADPDESGVSVFEELTDDVMASAMSCAEAIATLVAQGVFWPCQRLRNSWEDPFEALFLNGTPSHSLAPETIEFLEGKR